MAEFRYGDRDRALARKAYQAFEPYHLVAYFGDYVSAARKELGLRWHAAYTGMRAAPMGAVAPALVTSAFFAFNPVKLEPAWTEALDKHGVDGLNAARTKVVDLGLREALGDKIGDPALADAADRLRGIISTAECAGRPLGAAYAAMAWPDEPHLALWQATSIWREWRGDGHIASLVIAGLDPVEAIVAYDAGLRDVPAAIASGRDRAALQPTRAWSDEVWEAAVDRLAGRDVLERDGDSTRLTEAGAALRQQVEDRTDDASASVWSKVSDEDAVQAFAAARPWVKAVIDSGLLPRPAK